MLDHQYTEQNSSTVSTFLKDDIDEDGSVQFTGLINRLCFPIHCMIREIAASICHL